MHVENIVVVGFGNVGRSLAKLLAFKHEVVERKYNVKLRVVAVLDSKGAVVKPQGLSPYELLKLCSTPRSRLGYYEAYGELGVGVEEVYSKVDPTIHVELTPSNYDTGEPGISHILYAIRNGVHVVSANKAPFALKYNEIMSEALNKNVLVRIKATVMAGTPLINMLMGLKGYDVKAVEGILNGTVNYVLTEMHNKLISFNEALSKAQALGIAEANPYVDVSGLDAAAKLVIISNILGKPIALHGIERENASRITVREIYEAVRRGYVVKYIAKLDLEEEKAYVKLIELPLNDVLAKVEGTFNGVKITTDVNNIVVIGKGAGGIETAHAVLDDIIDIALGRP